MHQSFIGINTHRANALVKEALQNNLIIELMEYDEIRAEVMIAEQKTRIDFQLSAVGKPVCWVEVKSVTLNIGQGIGLFPDAKTARGIKHLEFLISRVQQGERAVLFFCVQHTGIQSVAPADDLDPAYGKMLRCAANVGVEILAYGASISPETIYLEKSLPVNLL